VGISTNRPRQSQRYTVPVESAVANPTSGSTSRKSDAGYPPSRLNQVIHRRKMNSAKNVAWETMRTDVMRKTRRNHGDPSLLGRNSGNRGSLFALPVIRPGPP
jgi:hypothetical protein